MTNKFKILFIALLLSGFLLVQAQETTNLYPEIPFFKSLVLVDEIDCSEQSHNFSTNGITEVKTILGKECRVLKPSTGSNYFYYRLGTAGQLKAGKAYFLEVEYPDDVDRNFVVQNRGGEYTRGIQTGKTIGDLYEPPYVQSNPESVSLPHSAQYLKWQTLFWLHDHYAGLELPRNQGSRLETPEDGFLVIICQFDSKNNPFSQGAAVSAIRLYEAPDFETMKLDIHYPPADLPRRHLFFREEMSDGVVDNDPPAVNNPTDWYEHKAQLMHFLGMNTFSKDLLEFGHNQGWDPGPYASLVNTPAWKDRWENILEMLGNYDLDVMPYYEYAGTIGPQGLGPQQRAHPLNDALPDFDYTHISWTEGVNADITDPDTYADLKKIFERTIIIYKDKVNFIGAWLRPRSSENPISFADSALNRFSAEANSGVAVTRSQIKSDTQLYEKYLSWWFVKRKEFLLAMRDFIREEGSNDQAVILYTTDYTESGKTHYDWGYNHNVITDDKSAWLGLSYTYPLFNLNEYIENDWQLEAQLLPENTWGEWEWQHATPVPDPDHYKVEDGVLLTYTFNKAYTVGSKTAFERFRTETGLAIIRHYCLNEDGMKGMGYFVTDIDWHGPYTMMAEARAMANGDPRYIGYLASSAFNKGSIEYVREFNSNFLALPALPSSLVENASDDPEIVVRKIEANEYGTYLAIVNTSFEDKLSVNIKLPARGDVADASNGLMILADVSEIILDMYPAQLKSYIIFPSTGKLPQTIKINDILSKSSDDEPFKVSASASSGLDVTWKLVSGPATLEGDIVTITSPGWINLEALQVGNEYYYPASEKTSIRVDSASNINSVQTEHAETLRFYPNPSDDLLFIELQNPADFNVYNTSGKKVMELKLNNSQSIDISELSPGLYVMEIINKDSKFIQKFIRTY